MIQSIAAHPDFQTSASWIMSVLTPGTDDIVIDSGQTFSSITSQSVNPQVYTNIALVYVPGVSYTSDVSYPTFDESITVVENVVTKITPEIPWSISGSTSISFNIANYLTTAPSWVTINSVTGELAITAPDVANDIEYDFYINSIVSGVAIPIQKLIKLIVKNWVALNWQKCKSTSNLVWDQWNSGFDLNSGLWNAHISTPPQNSPSISETSKAISIAIKSIEVAIFGCAILTSISSISSLASFWMTINQLQIWLNKTYFYYKFNLDLNYLR